MSPKKLPTKSARKKAPITIMMKKEIIRKDEEGKQIVDIACKYSEAFSTIATIIKKKKDIKGFSVAEGVTLIASKKQCPEIMNEVENLLLV